jgi:hypothetical protein
MIARWDRWGPVSGLLLCLTWAPMALVIPRLPDLDTSPDVQAFWGSNRQLMQGVILSVSVGFLFLLVFLGALVELVRSAHGADAAAWTVLGSALMFMTALNIALGLDITGGLLVDSDPASTYVLHTAAFLLAAPAAFAGTAFFVVIAVITWQARVFPRWSGWIAVLGAVVNAGAVLGILSLNGPLNSGNGIVGGIAGPLGLYLTWVFSISAWWMRETARSPLPSAPADRA